MKALSKKQGQVEKRFDKTLTVLLSIIWRNDNIVKRLTYK